MHRICLTIWETDEWPENWTYSTFIPLPKKGDLKQCAYYWTIYLVSHASKILLRVIWERMRLKTETEIADEKVGFRQGRATTDQITNLRILMQKAREHQQPLYMCFVDFKKVFDSVSHEKLRVTVMEMGYPSTWSSFPYLGSLITECTKDFRARLSRAQDTTNESSCVSSSYEGHSKRMKKGVSRPLK